MEERCVAALNTALTEAFEARDDVYLLGEDVLDPYGGAFKVTQGLSSRWPKRVITTPVSEGAIFGIAAGMALRGWRPVLEIMEWPLETPGTRWSRCPSAPYRVDAFMRAGANRMTVHVEAEACRDPRAVLRDIRSAGALPGLAVNPETPIQAARPRRSAATTTMRTARRIAAPG